jgi:N,N'-diacetyllegionaminate synthase
MKLFGKDLAQDLLIVAEIGVNHEGSLSKAQELVSLAAQTGVDAVKFQTYRPDHFISTSTPERYERVSRFGLPVEAFAGLAELAESLGLGFFSSAIDETVIPDLAAYCSVIKVASADLTFEPTIRGIAVTGKPMILSTGVGTVEEIGQALDWAQAEIGDVPLKERVILTHCVSAYPTPMEEANLLAIPFLRDRFGVLVGYSDHTLGSLACLGAVSLGACVIEKHFTDQKTGRDFRDHELSADPDEMRALVEAARQLHSALGTYDKRPMPSELSNRDVIRKGVVASRDLAAGTVLTREDLMFARPATEIPAAQIGQVIGRTLVQDLSKGHVLSDALLKD